MERTTCFDVPRPKQSRKRRPRNHKSKNSSYVERDASETTCPICFHEVEKQDRASLPGCGHFYCVYCIVQWAEDKLEPSCPQCKKKFDSIMISRSLDGKPLKGMVKESICLVKRTHWYRSLKAKLQTECLIDQPRGNEDDDYWEDNYFEENEIDDTEDFYFSNAAGSARIVLSNRKFGKNGFIRSGRVFAQTNPAETVPDKIETASDCVVNKVPKERKTNPKGQRAKRREDKKKQDVNRIF